jgi:hypothetical protein
MFQVEATVKMWSVLVTSHGHFWLLSDTFQILLCIRHLRVWVLVASQIQFSAVTLVYQVCPTLLEWRCSDVLFIGKIISRKWPLLYELSLLISELMFVFLLLSLLETKLYLFIVLFQRSFFVSIVKTSVHTNMCYKISNIFGEPIE